MKTKTYQTDNPCMAQNYTPTRNEEVNGVKDSQTGFSKMIINTNCYKIHQ